MDRWEQISGIVRAALSRAPHERDAYLDTACADDGALRRQVEALLVTADDTRTSTAVVPRLGSGNVFAHYRITGELGAGGMGEVYRARDERLDREVAVKVLPPSRFDDPAARARLVREAKAVAALNHPNICTVYEVGEAAGQAYIAMELIEGRTLRARLSTGPLQLEQVLAYGRQLADALTHAHDRGIVHRDLKSNNVIVMPDERVKVLDFGLAKRTDAADLPTDVTEMNHTLTQPGTAVGTLPYMSPEQLRGQSAKVTSDIWALGVMLYEMAAGERPFRGQTPFEMSAAILANDPPPLPAHLPPALGQLIAGCLEKDATQRTQTAAAVRAALDAVPAHTRQTPPAVETQPAVAPSPARTLRLPSRRVIAITAAIVLVGAAGVAAWRFWPETQHRLAVLPFVNTARNKDADYLSDGIAESLIAKIGRQPSIAVSRLETVLPFGREGSDPRDAGRELGVEAVLTGSFEQQGAQLLISARMIDVATGRKLWDGSYDKHAADLLEVQDQIARAVIREGLGIRITSNTDRQLAQRPTTDGDAYDLYLQARHLQRMATEEDYLYSRELLERAIVRDPKFALAHAALGGNYAMMVVDGLVRPTDAWPNVNRYMKQAIAIDPDLPYAHTFAHAIAFLFDWDWPEAERQRKILLQYPIRDLDPQALRAVSVELWAVGRPLEALQLARRMRELDPASPYLGTLEADYLINAGQFEAAVPLYERSIRLDAGNANAYFGLAEANAKMGRFDEAIAVRRKAHEVAGDTTLTDVLAAAKGEAGYRAIDQAWARVQLEELKQRQESNYASPLDFARAYAQLGDKPQAFKYLDAAFIDRSPGLVFLNVDRAWDQMRDDPRFLEAVRKVGLK